MRRNIAIAGVLGLTSVIVWLTWPSAPSFSMVPMGPVVSADGTGGYMVGLTNNSRSSVECHVCRLAAGASTIRRVVLPAHSATVVALPLKGGHPWTLDVFYERTPGEIEFFLRRVGARLHLCARKPAREKLESVQVTQ